MGYLTQTYTVLYDSGNEILPTRKEISKLDSMVNLLKVSLMKLFSLSAE